MNQELDDLRKERDKLTKELNVFKTKLELAERKVERAVSHAEETQQRFLQLEKDFLALQQEKTVQETRLLRKVSDLEDELANKFPDTCSIFELQALQQEKDRLERMIVNNIGSQVLFDREETRVLHMKPMARADFVVRASTSTSSSSTVGGAPLPPGFSQEKYTQRLTEMFKAQISLLREGLYLLFGWKVEMTPDEEHPVFKLKSMFAESSQDWLVFRLDVKTKKMELLNSEFARNLDAKSMEYILRMHSFPAFIADVTLELFAKTTVQ